MTCPKCGTAVVADEKFCTQCGYELAAGSWGLAKETNHQSVIASAREQLGAARKWLMAIAILTLLSGFWIFHTQSAATEKQIQETELATQDVPREQLDAYMKAQSGMTFEEAKAHDRGMVRILLAVNIGMAAIYLGLWFWARQNAYAAALVALLLFVTVVVISAVLEPKSLVQGVLLKILFIAALAKAVQAGLEERRLLGAT